MWVLWWKVAVPGIERTQNRPVSTLGEAVRAAQELHALGAGAVLASLGRDGLLLVDGRDVCHATTGPADPPERAGAVRGTAGAGDAALAGFLIAGGDGPGALRSALAHGAAAGRLPGSVRRPPAGCRAPSCRPPRTCGRTRSASRGTCPWTSRSRTPGHPDTAGPRKGPRNGPRKGPRKGPRMGR